MLDFADLVIINKFDRRGAEDALRDRRQAGTAEQGAFDVARTPCPSTARLHRSTTPDLGVDAAYLALMAAVDERRGRTHQQDSRPRSSMLPAATAHRPARPSPFRLVSLSGRCAPTTTGQVNAQADSADALQAVDTAASILGESAADAWETEPLASALDPAAKAALEEWDAMQDAYGDTFTYSVQGKDIGQLTDASLSGLPIPRITLLAYRAR